MRFFAIVARACVVYLALGALLTIRFGDLTAGQSLVLAVLSAFAAQETRS